MSPTENRVILSHDSEDGGASIQLDFDLEAAPPSIAPMARLQLGTLEKVAVKRPGQPNIGERGAVHVFVISPGAPASQLAGSTPVKPGGAANAYTIDVTPAIQQAIAQLSGQRKIHLEVRLTGKPLPYEVYALASGEGKPVPTLEIAAAPHAEDDSPKRMIPITGSGPVWFEPCLPIAENTGREVDLRLLYPAEKILSVVSYATGEPLEEDRDWLLRDGRLVLPPGSHAPIQLAKEFFSTAHTDPNTGAVKNLPTAVRLVDGTWYHERQIEVSYQPAVRDWPWPAAHSNLDQLPRLKKRLAEKTPVTVLLFGDSISAGYNSSRFIGVWPFQPDWGDLVRTPASPNLPDLGHLHEPFTRRRDFRIRRDPSREPGRMVSSRPRAARLRHERSRGRPPRIASRQYGNDHRHRARALAGNRIPHRHLHAQQSPANSTLASDPILFIHDEVLKIDRPGVAFADVTTAHLELLKHKNYLDLSGNGANHPNDFLHRVYAQRVLEVLAPPRP